MPSLSRYSFTPTRKNDLDQSYKPTTRMNSRIRRSVLQGQVQFKVHILDVGERLDILSHLQYGSPEYWWIIAAASGIGWSLQVPPGTMLNIPISINEVIGLLR